MIASDYSLKKEWEIVANWSKVIFSLEVENVDEKPPVPNVLNSSSQKGSISSNEEAERGWARTLRRMKLFTKSPNKLCYGDFAWRPGSYVGYFCGL
ncbi:hypothetical protein Ddye_029841 [Dipteronia dyeriana]|uniref:Uncharacterized protein n=1 Tax=Dipteronia dyeriana TaxID=168575 RepID=A0AAD9TF61_9ROSI|nr:hypothetical protein Ddye_029841 [Dipteronia dyeriana]